MKKLIACLLLVVILATMLTACGSFKCEMCGKEDSGSGNDVNYMGKDMVVCDECEEGIEAAKDLLGGLAG